MISVGVCVQLPVLHISTLYKLFPATLSITYICYHVV